MRIALVIKRFASVGGSERQALQLACGLRDRGHEVAVFCRSASAHPEGIPITTMPPLVLGEVGDLLGFSGWARRAIQRSGPFDVRHTFARTVGQDVYRLGGGCHRTYLEHAHALGSPDWLRRWRRGSPVERTTCHLERAALTGRPAPRVVVNSRMTRDDVMARYGIPAERIHLVRNGIDLQRFRPPALGEREAVRGSWGLDDNDEVLLFLGTGYRRKGLETTLRAVARLVPERPHLRLVVVGRDHRSGRWQRLAARLGLGSRVIWLGQRDDAEACYRGSDVYVLPSAYDPAANTTGEALASGLPVVTSRRNGASEILEPGVTGTVLDTPVHTEELAQACLHWLGVPDRAAVSRAARAAAGRHPEAAGLKAMLDVYDAVVHDRAPSLGSRPLEVGVHP